MGIKTIVTVWKKITKPFIDVKRHNRKKRLETARRWHPGYGACHQRATDMFAERCTTEQQQSEIKRAPY